MRLPFRRFVKSVYCWVFHEHPYITRSPNFEGVEQRLTVVGFSIEGGGLGVFRPEEVGPLSVQVPNGVVDVAVADEAEAVRIAKQYLCYFQGPLASFSVVAKGDHAKLSEHVESLLKGGNGVALDAHSIQPYYASRMASADDRFWADVAAEMQARFGRALTHEELWQLGEQGRLGTPLELLARESPYSRLQI